MRHRFTGLLVAGIFLSTASFAAADGWGTIKGQATWSDAPLKPEALKVDKDERHCLSRGPILSEQYVINAQNKGVRWVVVYLSKEGDNETADFFAKMPIHPDLVKIDKKTVVMDQPCCRFEPHVVVLRKGQDFVGKNSSPVVHNMSIEGKNGVSLNQVIPAGGSMTVPAEKWKPWPGPPTTVSCGIHKWMKARLFCFDHPYFAITDENGNFEIRNAPAGTYRLVGSHAGWGWTTDSKEQSKNGIRVKIEDGKSTTVRLSVYKSSLD